LTVEIEVYQQEIEKLKTELAALQQPKTIACPATC